MIFNRSYLSWYCWTQKSRPHNFAKDSIKLNYSKESELSNSSKGGIIIASSNGHSNQNYTNIKRWPQPKTMHGPPIPSINYAPFQSLAGIIKLWPVREKITGSLTSTSDLANQRRPLTVQPVTVTPSKFPTTSTYGLCASPFRFRGVTGAHPQLSVTVDNVVAPNVWFVDT